MVKRIHLDCKLISTNEDVRIIRKIMVYPVLSLSPDTEQRSNFCILLSRRGSRILLQSTSLLLFWAVSITTFVYRSADSWPVVNNNIPIK